MIAADDIGMAAPAGPAPADREGDRGGGYSRTAIFLHWAIAALIAFNLACGFVMESLTPAGKRALVNIHVSVGFTIFALTVARVAWRLIHKPPPEAPGLTRWEQSLSRAAHLGLYVLMVAMPLTGWAIVSSNPPAGSPGQAEWFAALTPARPAGGAGASLPEKTGPTGKAAPMQGMPMQSPGIWFGLLPQPVIRPLENIGYSPGGVKPQMALKKALVRWHMTGAFILLGLMFLHIAGALKHHFMDGYDELGRMGIGRRRGRHTPTE